MTTALAVADKPRLTLRHAATSDLKALVAIEQRCFVNDRLSARSFRHYIQAEHSLLLVAESQLPDGSSQLLGYGLIWCHRGTRLARLYSLAVLPEARGQGVARWLLESLEKYAADAGRLYMRLEVSEQNRGAIDLYRAVGYRVFGEYSDYYEDHSDALRMQKRIRVMHTDGITRRTPWYQQTTEFTCGPASLMMAMASLAPQFECSQALELQLWREATTIFMTSGLGGCHPFGLALAAQRRGFEAQVQVNTDQPLFVDGVRVARKKAIMTQVHHQFLSDCQAQGVAIGYQEITQLQVEQWLREGYAVLALISTYRLDGKKAPHWVVVTGVDDRCLYVHDPDLDPEEQLALDCQHVPIARQDFDKMAAFGSGRLRTAVAIKPDPLSVNSLGTLT